MPGPPEQVEQRSGQGGAGIETSPAVGRIAADLIMNGHTDLMDAQILTPKRFKEN